jgi:hypothetical protein
MNRRMRLEKTATTWRMCGELEGKKARMCLEGETTWRRFRKGKTTWHLLLLLLNSSVRDSTGKMDCFGVGKRERKGRKRRGIA